MLWSCWECVELCHLSTGTITCIQSEDTHSTPSAMDMTWQPTGDRAQSLEPLGRCLEGPLPVGKPHAKASRRAG